MQGAQGQDAWKRAMNIAAEHSESDWFAIYGDGCRIGRDASSLTVGQPVYTVSFGDDGISHATADQVTRFLAEKGVDASKFE